MNDTLRGSKTGTSKDWNIDSVRLDQKDRGPERPH
jgi:hypothetical protein